MPTCYSWEIEYEFTSGESIETGNLQVTGFTLFDALQEATKILQSDYDDLPVQIVRVSRNG